jgi:endoglucanase
MNVTECGAGIRWRNGRLRFLLPTLLVLLGCQTVLAAPPPVSPYIKIDQFGYLPGSAAQPRRKVAIIADPQVGNNAAESFTPGSQYQVRRWDNDAVMHTGTPVRWSVAGSNPTNYLHAQSGDAGWQYDFTALITPGDYYIYDVANNVGTGLFKIDRAVYDKVLKQAVRMFYYQRINFPKSAPYAQSPWIDAPAYGDTNQDYAARSGFAKSDASTAKDLSGGWMDAGDANKYTTFAEHAVLQLLDTYRFNPSVFGDNLGIPESGNGIPDLLDEIKYELDFLKRMQDATGPNKGFFLKVGNDNYDDTRQKSQPLSFDKRPRYYLGECTSATLSGSAIFAAAALVYRNIPSLQNYGNDLLTRSIAAWDRASITTKNTSGVSFTSFKTDCDDIDSANPVANIKSGDADNDVPNQKQSALLAAIYLYEATNNLTYKNYVESHYTEIPPFSNNYWGPSSHPLEVALLRFAGMPSVTATVAADIRNKKASQNNEQSVTDYSNGVDLYRAYILDVHYQWGSNMLRSKIGNLNLDFNSFGINQPTPPLPYREVADQHLHWLHGANPLGMVMLSNMYLFGAKSSANEINHAWFGDGTPWDRADPLNPNVGPPPGYLVGGPNKAYNGTASNIANQPPQKAYKDWNSSNTDTDFVASYQITEPSNEYQAAYIQLLARLIGTDNGGDNTSPSLPTGLASNSVTQTTAIVTWQPATDNVAVTGYDVFNGTTLAGKLAGTALAVSNLFCGTSNSFTVRAFDAAGNYSLSSAPLTVTTTPCPTSTNWAYIDSVQTDWTDWSWSAVRQFLNGVQPVHGGTKSIKVDYGPYGGLSLRHATGIAMGPTSKLKFWAFSSTAVPLRVTVQTEDSNTETGAVNVTIPAGIWTPVNLTGAQLGAPNRTKRLSITLNSATLTTVYLDDIQVSNN